MIGKSGVGKTIVHPSKKREALQWWCQDMIYTYNKVYLASAEVAQGALYISVQQIVACSVGYCWKHG